MRLRFILCLMLFASLASGCTSRQVYDSAAGWRQSECNKIIENDARAKCMETANKDYDRYRKDQQ